MSDSDDKYVTFKRADFDEMVWGNSNWQPWEIKDAVVIRRQDYFASPCLATYASMISLVAKNITDTEQGKELMAIADYFEGQAQLAAEEGWKLPDR